MRLLTRKISARLSTRRRSRFAAPAVLILGLLATGGIWVAVAPATAEQTTVDDEKIQAGRALFAVSCASCHGLNGEGITTKKGNQYGPSLIGVGAASVDFQVLTGRMPMAQAGAQAPRKRPVFSEEETEQLGAFVGSLGAGPSVPEPSQYDPTGADIARGGEFFRTNCTACHNFAGTGGALPKGKYAPTLVGVSDKHIYEAMITGPQQMPVFSDGVLTPQAKRDVIAYLNSVENAPNPGGFSLGAIGPVAEGMFVWLVGIGSLVGFGIWITAGTARTKKAKKEAGA